MGNYTVYVNPCLVLRSDGYTKHYYIEGQRIVSKLGGGWDHNPQGQGKAGENSVNYSQKQEELREAIVKNLKFLGLDGQVLTAGKSGKIPPGQVKGTGNGAENSSAGARVSRVPRYGNENPTALAHLLISSRYKVQNRS